MSHVSIDENHYVKKLFLINWLWCMPQMSRLMLQKQEYQLFSVVRPIWNTEMLSHNKLANNSNLRKSITLELKCGTLNILRVCGKNRKGGQKTSKHIFINCVCVLCSFREKMGQKGQLCPKSEMSTPPKLANEHSYQSFQLMSCSLSPSPSPSLSLSPIHFQY